jgi:hypothetical protein
MGYKFGLAALVTLWVLAPSSAWGQQYFDYPRYRLPGGPSPIVNNPPGRLSPFPGNQAYLPQLQFGPQPNYVAPVPRGWAFTAAGSGGLFQNTQPGAWTLTRDSGSSANFLELYRTPSYAELYNPGAGGAFRLTNNTLYRDYAGVYYPVVQGWWQ